MRDRERDIESVETESKIGEPFNLCRITFHFCFKLHLGGQQVNSRWCLRPDAARSASVARRGVFEGHSAGQEAARERRPQK